MNYKQPAHSLNEPMMGKLQIQFFVMTALIDCFTRRGYVKKAMDFVFGYEEIAKRKGNGQCDNKFMWMSLLNACKQYKDNEMEHIYEQIEQRFGADEASMDSVKIKKRINDLY